NILDAVTGVAVFDFATVSLDTCSITNNGMLGIGIYQNSHVEITGCKVWDNGSGIRSYDSDVTIRESSVRYNGQFGIHAGGASEPDLDIENSHVSNNIEGFRLTDSARPRVKNCAIFLNEAGTFKYAVRLDSYTGGGVLDFESNFWGMTDAPSIAAMMSLGGGNATVDFDPWLNESPVPE
ncbi:MAG TPA: right-handed parallel beta-helix repeat-containing protein, partial [Candidatus Krumholzibacterium sp.]|nr:right-handed parallel beta-helix repeat-containing protein [Candidatus Krumholzibacterium sp.]